MENVEQFMAIINEDICSLHTFKLLCIFKDMCLKNYKYKPRLGNCNQIIHEWQHFKSYETLTVDTMRKILTHDVFEIMTELQLKYIAKIRIESKYKTHYGLQKKIKKLSDICIMLEKGLLFKEFIDCYRDGYFN